MDWNTELWFTLRILLAAVLGGIIGWERESHDRDAGVRTYMAVAVGSCTFCIVSTHIPGGDTRIAAQVVSGMGFIGAGVILQIRGRVQGLTTAATLWATAAVGMACAFGMYLLSCLTACLIFVTLTLDHIPGWNNFVNRHHRGTDSKEQ
jgi:putative Mg2+ transporter-C (MgtC) family protein